MRESTYSKLNLIGALRVGQGDDALPSHTSDHP
jgi:hypothetical protein